MKRLNDAFGKLVKTAGIAAIAGLCLATARGEEPAADLGKIRIERPARMLAEGAAIEVEYDSKVEPGRVKWHADLEGARAAARSSGKPVLLFQMMGRLDDRFC